MEENCWETVFVLTAFVMFVAALFGVGWFYATALVAAPVATLSVTGAAVVGLNLLAWWKMR